MISNVWLPTPDRYPFRCASCGGTELHIGPYHRGSEIDMFVPAQGGDVGFTIWTCQVCTRGMLIGVDSPLRLQEPEPVVDAFEIPDVPITTASKVTYEVGTVDLSPVAIAAAVADELERRRVEKAKVTRAKGRVA